MILFNQEQWHLSNTAQFKGLIRGEDINAEAAWQQGARGKGVRVVMVDDGLDAQHADLVANVSLSASWNYQFDIADVATPNDSQNHGTLVAGLLASVESNGVGGRGVAPAATLAVYDLLWSVGVSDADIYDAMVRNQQSVGVSSNSWGLIADGTGEVNSPVSTLWQQGVEEGATTGRDGKGVVYVWSAGNGGVGGVDNANFDFQANNPYVMAVAALNGKGQKATYSEEGANLWLSAPGGDVGAGLTTTDLRGSLGLNKGNDANDVGDADYTRFFAGTSAAAPLVAGVAALVLSINPQLSWRDVRLILAQSARKNDSSDTGWVQTNPASGQPVYNINHKYGFGAVDAGAAVALAKNWSSVGPMLAPVSYTRTGLSVTIPDNTGAVVENTIAVPASMAGRVIEYVTIEVDITHGYIGDLEISLIAPDPAAPNASSAGTRSLLSHVRPCKTTGGVERIGSCLVSYAPWTFGSARHLGESPVGNWTLRVADKAGRGVIAGRLNGWQLTFYTR